MRTVYIKVIKYTLMYFLTIGFLFVTIGYAATEELAFLIGYAMGVFGPLYLLYRLFTRNRRRSCPYCRKPVSYIGTEFVQTESKITMTTRVIDFFLYGASKEVDKYDIVREKVSVCEHCEKRVVLKAKPYVVSTTQPEKYLENRKTS